MAMRSRREKRKERTVTASRRLREHKTGFDKLALRVPQGIGRFNPPKESASYKVDVIPFTAGKGNPFAKPGELYYERTYWAHYGVGPNNDTVGCNAKNFKKACAICDVRNKMAADPDADSDLIKSMFPRERQVFLFYVHSEKKKGVQFHENSFNNLGKFLDNKINTARGKDRKIRDKFADPNEGCTLEITGSKETTGKYPYLEFNDIQFVPRKKPLDPELWENAPCLDEWVPLEDYKKVKELLLQSGGEDDEEETEDEEEDEDGDDDEDTDDDDGEEDDDEGEDEEDSEDGEDEEESDDEDDLADEDEEVEVPCAKGDMVLFRHKGKKGKGKVISVNEDDMMVRVKDPNREQPRNLEYDEIVKVLKPAGKPNKPGKFGRKKSREADF